LNIIAHIIIAFIYIDFNLSPELHNYIIYQSTEYFKNNLIEKQAPLSLNDY